MKDMRLWYLAHPVTPDEKHTFEDNLEHTRAMLRMCHEHGFYAVAPWYGMVEAYKEHRGTTAYAAYRELGLFMDEANVAVYGRIILTGHIISEGMQRELDVIDRLYPYPHASYVINLVGLTDKEARQALKIFSSRIDERV